MTCFDKEINRFDTNSYKWDISKNELPMWVADMDFQTAPAVIDAIKKRTSHGIFGYNTVPNEFNQTLVTWWKEQHNLFLKEDWILFCTGVVPAISSIVRKLTKVDDNIVVLSPVYNIFYNSIVNNDRHVLSSDLLYSNGEYQINYADLEEKITNENTSMLIFCNPHNPIGKIWDKETLEKIGQLCIKNDVIIVSDEIHCDLTFPNESYNPFLTVSDEITEKIIMCCSPSKAFNIAGLQTAAIIIKNENLRKLVNRGINTDEVAEPNSFAIDTTIAAFTGGKEWLVALNDYLYQNRLYIETFISTNLPEFILVKSQATYLAWIDCSKLTTDTVVLCDFIRNETGLYLTSGDIFGANGQSFIRLNYATNLTLVKKGMQKLLDGIKKYKAEANVLTN